MARSRKKKSHQCTYEDCPKAYASKRSLDEHIMRKHTGERPFKCTYEDCPKAFVTKRRLDEHVMRKHTGKRPFKCTYEDCPKAFVTKRELDEHIMREHTGKRPFKCTYEDCPKAFVTKRNLDEHIMREHTGKRPFKCTYEDCSEAFILKGKLKIHVMRKHTGERPFKCAYEGCSEAFVTNWELKIHVMHIHTGERPHKCSKCDYAGVTSSDLKRHLELKACGFYLREAFLWERVLRESTRFLRSQEWESLPTRILTPEIEDQEYVVPDTGFKHIITGTIEFDEAKRTVDAIKEKDVFIYPMIADRINLYILHMPRDLPEWVCMILDGGDSISLISSEQLIHQLEARKTKDNSDEINQLIQRIIALQQGLPEEELSSTGQTTLPTFLGNDVIP